MQSKPSKQDSLRMKAEAKLAQITPAESPSRPVADMLHELQVHQIELEMHNEELRRAQIALEESRDHYIDFYDFAPVGYLTLTDKGLIAEINLTGAQLLGVERKQLIQQRLARFATPEERDHIYQCLLTVLKHDEKFSFDTLFKRQDGSNFYAQMDCRRLVKMGEERIVRVVMTDITERKHVESDLRIAAVAFNSQESIMITDAHGVIMRVNQAFTQNTGYTAEEAVGQTLRLLKSGRHNADFYRAMWEELVHTGI